MKTRINGNLEIVEETHGVRFEVEVGKAELYLATVVGSDSPEALRRVSIRQRIVGRHKTAGQTTQLATTPYTRHD